MSFFFFSSLSFEVPALLTKKKKKMRILFAPPFPQLKIGPFSKGKKKALAFFYPPNTIVLNKPNILERYSVKCFKMSSTTSRRTDTTCTMKKVHRFAVLWECSFINVPQPLANMSAMKCGLRSEQYKVNIFFRLWNLPPPSAVPPPAVCLRLQNGIHLSFVV